MNDEGMGTGIFLGGSMIGIYVFMSCLQRNPEETRKARSLSSSFFQFLERKAQAGDPSLKKGKLENINRLTFKAGKLS